MATRSADEEGRTVDVRALRHTKATWMAYVGPTFQSVFGEHRPTVPPGSKAPRLAMAGVPIRKAQEEMRHSTIMLTMRVYTDVRLLDDGEAVAALPSLDCQSNRFEVCAGS
ncbi:MAG TPA: hypothetical protein P5572_07350 [Phycisphaerae bacterium]|nr:hypothetical protein [Phycisphaerae bacterium]